MYWGNNASSKCLNLICDTSPAGVWSVYKTLPSLVLPALRVKSVAASVQIDSSTMVIQF